MYNNSFQRSNPGLFVFLLDQSGSMEDPMRASNGLALDVNAADASFRDDESTRRYIDTAICKNIQHVSQRT